MIYCVEDDQGIRDLMIYTLKATGYEARSFSCAEELYDALEKELPQLVLLDIMLPGEDGISILKKIRSQKRTADIPVIMASAKGTEYDKVIGLDLGADDYLAKPFGMMEMVSRVNAVLRRSAKSVKHVDYLTMGDLQIDRAGHEVLVSGERVQLTLKEYEILNLLMEKPGIVYTRQQLLDMIWGIDFLAETRTVDVHIGTLRSKLGSCGDYIKTVRGVGYKMEEGK